MRRALILTPLLAAALAAPAAAQEPATGTPEVEVRGFTACVADPRPPAELVALWFGPDDAPVATPPPVVPVTEAELPRGEAVDERTAAEANATIVGVLACFDDQLYARAFALMTDDLVAQFGPDVTNPAEDTAAEVEALLAAQLAVEGMATPTLGIEPAETVLRDVRRLADDRIGGVFDEAGGSAFLLFERSADGWLLAEIIPIAPGSLNAAAPSSATPAP